MIKMDIENIIKQRQNYINTLQEKIDELERLRKALYTVDNADSIIIENTIYDTKDINSFDESFNVYKKIRKQELEEEIKQKLDDLEEFDAAKNL